MSNRDEWDDASLFLLKQFGYEEDLRLRPAVAAALREMAERYNKKCARCGSNGSCDADFHCATCYREGQATIKRHEAEIARFHYARYGETAK